MMNARRRCLVSTCTALLIGLLLSPADLRAEDVDDQVLARAQATREQQARRAGELIDGLHLTRLQARKLVPIAEEAARLHIQAYETQAQLLPEMLETFGEFAREDSLNQGFSRDVERRTAALNQRAKQAQERITEQLIALGERASKVLNASQRGIVNSLSQKQRPIHSRASRTDARGRARAAARQREEERKRPLREARQELSALHQRMHPQPGPIGRCLLHPFGAERLCQVARIPTPEVVTKAASVLRQGTPEHPAELIERQRAGVSQLRAEINKWNLINGLHLSEDQIERIVALYDQAVAPSWSLARQDPGSGVPKRALAAMEREVEQVLNTGQRQVLAEYKPCLIPPKNLKDPVRVGQASDSSHYEMWLKRARKATRPQLAELIDRTLEKEAEHFGELSGAERQKRVALLRRTVRQASAMSETEFELNKAELAERIARPDRVKEMANKVAALARACGEPGAVNRFMLNRQFIDQLRVRGRQLAEGIATQQVDLVAGPQADNCDEGCAIDGKGAKGKKSSRKK